ncbi:LysR substrate-binding domain-containing protein [Burkholderiaceae bacterium FT117]|uniref:LysR family transcriptional regulator n=1 Tax=Zeimonas sediminis TaxID=2944268 RepID=UPI002342F694|nr:LysR family transcriptional regulator [Zeimonas sediminis]MCM5570939.1 LysR substrate-binding domain-containing protein [Zeimonas sediminis]
MNGSRLARLSRVTPQQLRAFEATARLLSVTGAARELHLTQPTVSVQLRELAATIGEPLFESAGRGIRLTQAGEALQQTAGELGDCWRRFESRLAELNGLVRGSLRIAAVTTAEYFVPDLVGPFAAAHPGVEIELAIENRDRVVERLQRGVDDVAVMMMPPGELPLERRPFLDNPLVVVAPAGHPLAGRRLRLASLAGERWLMREPGSGTRMAAEQHFAEVGFEPRVAMSLGSNEAIKHAVGAGLGIALLSLVAVRPPVGGAGAAPSEGLDILKVAGFPLRRRWSMVWRSDRPLTIAARRFIEHLSEARELRAPAGGRG